MEIPYYNTILDRFFAVLEINKDASFDEIKRRYHTLAFKYHPDKNPNNIDAENKMKEINEAYEVLKNNKSRINYVKKYGVYTTSSNTIDLGKTYQQEELEKLKESLKRIKDNYKEAYQQTRLKEKQSSFKNRFKSSYEYIEDEDYFGSINSILISEGLKITCVIGIELMYQLSKLRKLKDDTIPRYTVRNRKTLAGILIAGMLFNPVGVNAEIETQNNKQVTDSNIPMYLTDKQPIYRTYKTKTGDTVTSIAEQFNVSVEKLMQINNLKYDSIRENKEIKIPYYIEMDKVKSYTISVNTTEYDSLQDLAEEYQTDLRTIFSLNTECFEIIDGKYYQISDTLLVPDYSKIEELSYQKVYSKP